MRRGCDSGHGMPRCTRRRCRATHQMAPKHRPSPARLVAGHSRPGAGHCGDWGGAGRVVCQRIFQPVQHVHAEGQVCRAGGAKQGGHRRDGGGVSKVDSHKACDRKGASWRRWEGRGVLQSDVCRHGHGTASVRHRPECILLARLASCARQRLCTGLHTGAAGAVVVIDGLQLQDNEGEQDMCSGRRERQRKRQRHRSAVLGSSGAQAEHVGPHLAAARSASYVAISAQGASAEEGERLESRGVGLWQGGNPGSLGGTAGNEPTAACTAGPEYQIRERTKRVNLDV